jgi:outer membrane protein TolC
VQDWISDALKNRPEIRQAQVDLTNREVTRKAARNALLPTVDFVAFYGGSGLAGVQNPIAVPDGPIPPPSGFGDVLTRAFNNSSPDYYVGFSLAIPLRNRAAQADQVRSELEYHQAELRIQQLKNQIGIEVRNALFNVRQNRGRVAAARKARDLARNNFNIQQKMLTLGATTSSNVLAAGRDLALAESNLVAASTAYERARVEMERATGQTLSRLGISLGEAQTGVLSTQPTTPDTVKRQGN